MDRGTEGASIFPGCCRDNDALAAASTVCRVAGSTDEGFAGSPPRSDDPCPPRPARPGPPASVGDPASRGDRSSRGGRGRHRKRSTEHPEGGGLEGVLPVVPEGMRRVVGGDGVDDPLDEGLRDRLAVLGRAQGGLTLNAGRSPRGVRSRGQVMGCHLGVSAIPRFAQRTTSTPRPSTHARRGPAIPYAAPVPRRGDDRRLRGRRPASSPSRPDTSPSWHTRQGRRDHRILGVLEMTPPNGRRSRPAIRRASHAVAVVGEDPDPGAAAEPISPSSRGSCPWGLVTAPMGCTSTRPTRRPSSKIIPRSRPCPVAGVVLAMAGSP